MEVSTSQEKTKQNDIMEPYLSDSSQDDSLLKGVELASLPSTSSTEKLSESPSVSLDSMNLISSSSSSSSSSGFMSFSDMQHANRPTTPVKAIRPNTSNRTTSSSSSCDALSYVESNEAPTGQVQGLIQFEDWKDSDKVSMSAPSIATSSDLQSSNAQLTGRLDESDDSDIDDSMFQRLSNSITRRAQDLAQKEGRVESFLDEKPSQIAWERSTLTTGYHRFDDV